jgi:small subunit ribosomal protein S6
VTEQSEMLKAEESRNERRERRDRSEAGEGVAEGTDGEGADE